MGGETGDDSRGVPTAALTRAMAPLADDVIEAPPVARYALLLRPGERAAARLPAVAAALAPLDAVVRPLSSLEGRILVAEFPGRVFVREAAAFEAGYALADALDLDAAEPDLPTDLFPERQEPDGGATKDPAREGLDFPPGCWVAEEPELNARPHWALDAMRVKQAWAFSEAAGRPSRGDGIVVAQPDTGVVPHAELAGVPVASPRDVIDRDGDATDPMDYGANGGHGTATASVVVSRERAVVAGSAPAATHMPIRTVKSVVRVTQVAVAEAIDWAVDHGAHVITMSLGGIPSFSLHRALERAVAADVIVLAAAGNCVRTVVWPARYDSCIAVAGVNAADRQWRGSCRGGAVDISAPAQNVFRARAVGEGKDGGSGQGQGTSFAVALTAGVAALWLAHHGRANLVGAARHRGETLQTMFRRLIQMTARRTADWDAFEMGAGIVDAAALLRADLDAGLERETVAMPAALADRERLALEGLALETTGDPEIGDVDPVRYGPEIGLALLRRQQAAHGGAATAGPEPESGGGEAALSPRLRDLLGDYRAARLAQPAEAR